MYNNSFLAATIYGDGKHMELVEKWKVQNNKSNDTEENLSNFMKGECSYSQFRRGNRE